MTQPVPDLDPLCSTDVRSAWFDYGSLFGVKTVDSNLV
jgi:hypothetical protein